MHAALVVVLINISFTWHEAGWQQTTQAQRIFSCFQFLLNKRHCMLSNLWPGLTICLPFSSIITSSHAAAAAAAALLLNGSVGGAFANTALLTGARGITCRTQLNNNYYRPTFAPTMHLTRQLLVECAAAVAAASAI